MLNVLSLRRKNRFPSASLVYVQDDMVYTKRYNCLARMSLAIPDLSDASGTCGSGTVAVKDGGGNQGGLARRLLWASTPSPALRTSLKRWFQRSSLRSQHWDLVTAFPLGLEPLITFSMSTPPVLLAT